MRHQPRQESIRRLWHRKAELPAQSLQAISYKQRDIGHTVSQRRQHQVKDVEAKVQVRPEPLFLDRAPQIAPRRRHHTGPHPKRLGTADPLELPVVQHSQELRLKARFQIANFIEEDGPLACEFEAADVPHCCIRERTSFVTEQLALDQCRREGGAIDMNEWSL